MDVHDCSKYATEVDGEMVCIKCGKVLIEHTEIYQQRILEDKDYYNITVQPPTTYTDIGTQTAFPKTGTLLANNSYLNKQAMIYSKKEKIINEIITMGRKLGLSDNIIKEVILNYQRLYNQNKIPRGIAIKDYLTALLYYHCKKYNIPKTLKTITKLFDRKRRSVFNAYSDIVNKLGRVDDVTIESHINYIVNNLQLITDNKLKLKANEISNNIMHNFPSSPHNVIAAVAVSLACKELKLKVTDTQIAKLANITEVSLRANRAKILGGGKRNRNNNNNNSSSNDNINNNNSNNNIL
jgi:Transcription initiation factor TFIIIB, Brf1 subunit/Transcription initiation factor TFIIB